MPLKPWHVVDSRYLIRRWWMSLRQDHVRLPGGAEMEEFHVVEYPDWACVVCLTEDGELVMVEQYRHGIGRTSLELPAGAIEKEEDALEGARRELLEETGYASDDWTFLGRVAPEPSKHTNFAHFFVALKARRVAEAAPDETEHLVVRLLRPADVLQMADEGCIVHGTQLAAIYWALHRGLLPAG